LGDIRKRLFFSPFFISINLKNIQMIGAGLFPWRIRRGACVKKEMTATICRYHGLILQVHPEVYDPAEDSFLVVETVHCHAGEKLLEIGTGCGIISLECARQGAQVVCTDINPFAVETARANYERNRHVIKGSVEARQGDLFSALQDNETFDVIVFNPPYLPTSKKEKVGGWFDVATDGGADGLQVTTRFIRGVKKHLVKQGHAYIIFSSLSPRSTLENLLRKVRFSFEVVARHKCDGEEIDVYCLTPTD
jgi:release factor glutamine methyltransferase